MNNEIFLKSSNVYFIVIMLLYIGK